MIASIRARLQHSSGQFIRRSFLLAAGFAIARALGLMYSLLLGRVLSTEDYGYVQYSILLGGIIAIGTQPLLQHTLARYVSINRGRPEQLNRIVSTVIAMAVGLTLISLVVSEIVLALRGDPNPGALIVFLGLTVYNAYYGVARGFEDSARLSLVFIASNFVQFIALLVVFFVLDRHDSFPALAIYGLSYIGPVILLSLTLRFPVKLELRHVQPSTAREVARFTLPIWASHGLFALTAALDIFLLASMASQALAGTYAFNRTLTLLFDFLPSAVATMIMPSVAARAGGTRRLTLLSIAVVVAASVAVAAVFLPIYPVAMTMFFSADYQLPLTTLAIMIVGQTLWGIHGILSNVSVGQGRASVELASRACILVLLYTSCTLLIPSYGTLGVAVANLVVAAIVVATFPLLTRLLTRRPAEEPAAGAS